LPPAVLVARALIATIVTYGIGVGASRQVALVENEEEDASTPEDAGRESVR